jgi:hypothetical protein
MTASTDANDVLFGSNSPSAKFDQPGTTVGGIITSTPRSKQEQEWNQATQRSDGPPKFFPSGDPIMAVLIDVQTQLRDPSIQNDDGIRTIYIQGKRLKDAVRDAVRQAGAQRLEVGAEIYVTFTGLGPAPSAGANQPKEWAVRYVPGAQAAVGLGQQQPAAQQAPAQQAPVQQQPAAQQAPAAAGPTLEQVAAVKAAGLDPAQVFAGQQLPAGA